MKYTIDAESRTLQIMMEGNLSFLDSRLFQKLLKGINKCEGICGIHLNIKQLKSVDASGLHMLLTAHDAAKRNRRRLVFEGAHGQVEEALTAAALYNALILAT